MKYHLWDNIRIRRPRDLKGWGIVLFFCFSFLINSHFSLQQVVPTPTSESYPGPETSTPISNTPTTEPYPGPNTPTPALRMPTPTLLQPTSTATPFSEESLSQPLEFTGTITATATTTLIPLPELQVIFPTVVVSNVETKAPANLPKDIGPQKFWLTIERVIFLAFIFLVWALLGGWFYLSLRRLE